MMDAATMLKKARTGLVLDHPFFGSLAIKLTLTEDAGVATAATNGKRIRYNPTFVEGLTLPQVKGLLAHEVMHCAMGHPWRRGSRDVRRWNVACDFAINSIIEDAGIVLPDGSLNGGAFKDASAEAIYATLPEDSGSGKGPGQKGGKGEGAEGQGGGQQDDSQPGQPGQNQPDDSGDVPDPGGCGAVEDGPEGGNDKPEGKEAEKDWQIAAVQAEKVAKMMGNSSGGVERVVNDMMESPVDWRVVLQAFVERTAKNDYTLARPNRRYAGRDVVMPSLVSDQLPPVVLVMDTSGSIGQRELDRFGRAVSDILEMYDTTAVVIYADCKVQHVEEYTRQDLPLPLKAYGGGGTSFEPAFTYVKQNEINPCCLIYLTDLYGRFPLNPPPFPTMWVVESYTPESVIGRVPFGEVVKMSGSDD